MSTSEMEATASLPVGTEGSTQQASFGERVASLPVISTTCHMLSTAYNATKDSHPHVRTLCDTAEKGVRTLSEAAVSGAQPILAKLEPQINTASEYAHRGLDKLENSVSVLQQPPEKVLADTRELVSSKVSEARDAVSSAKDTVASCVTGAVDATRGAVQSGVDRTKGAVSSGVQSVMDSRVGQLVLSGVDTILCRSEEWVDNHLPMTDAELGRLATSLDGVDIASLQQQRQEQSYFVRLGSLSERLRQRAYQHSLCKLQLSRQKAQEALLQLAQALSLMEMAKQDAGQKLVDGQEKQLPGADADADAARPEQVESQTLTMVRDVAGQLQATLGSLGASVQGLPAHVKEQARLAGRHVEQLQATFAGVQAFRELTAGALEQSRGQLAQAREALDRVVDYVAQNVPVTWLVGPFAPGVVERVPEARE
ncbi:perilipin-3 [Sorex fumeus]|uniref:perilipin-3 n=1 Tax=Sorex fumeus TaxID=62283 RepID=UPI0024AD46E4|nr:perilipin-3 [Sorex fumeus]XP_055963228.1 perilipin-3 [Sorex fumeus]XP_055963230.1 perilipin-3 [Sorex fumeus]